MDKNRFNISSIESYLYSIINNIVSDNTFVGTSPETLSDSWKDVCVIDAGSSIADMDAYGRGVVLIWLYARPLANGAKNVAHMSVLETKLNEVIESANDGIYHINRRNIYSDYDATRKWHCNIVELTIKIF